MCAMREFKTGVSRPSTHLSSGSPHAGCAQMLAVP
jgi:hypothetical protein